MKRHVSRGAHTLRRACQGSSANRPDLAGSPAMMVAVTRSHPRWNLMRNSGRTAAPRQDRHPTRPMPASARSECTFCAHCVGRCCSTSARMAAVFVPRPIRRREPPGVCGQRSPLSACTLKWDRGIAGVHPRGARHRAGSSGKRSRGAVTIPVTTFDRAVQCGFDVTFPCLPRQFMHQLDRCLEC